MLVILKKNVFFGLDKGVHYKMQETAPLLTIETNDISLLPLQALNHYNTQHEYSVVRENDLSNFFKKLQ